MTAVVMSCSHSPACKAGKYGHELQASVSTETRYTPRSHMARGFLSMSMTVVQHSYQDLHADLE